MFQVRVNGEVYKVEKEHSDFFINEEKVEWDLVQVGQRRFNVIWNGRSFNADIVKADPNEKTFSIKVNGNYYEVGVKDKFDLLLKELGLENLASQKVNQIKAPMPGLVLNITVEEGQEVKKGDPVLVLEAMKMENVLKSPGDGKVKAIKVVQKQAVEKNETLIELE